MEALGINGLQLAVQFVSFLILIGLLWKFAYKPVLGAIDERSRRIREGMENAEQIKRELTETEERTKSQLDETRREAQLILARARESGEREVAEARNRAKQEGDKLIERARAEIQLERDQAVAELRQQVGDLALLAASRVVGASLDKETHYRLIDEVLSKTEGLQAD
jgi:F-type H+-transporting ATPase subunit b